LEKNSSQNGTERGATDCGTLTWHPLTLIKSPVPRNFAARHFAD
jgi:hypothetical protein